MNRSRAELSAHLMKAARGAGLPLALAEDLYQAAPYLRDTDVAEIAADIAQGGRELAALMILLDTVECGARLEHTPQLAPALAAARGWVLETGAKRAETPVPPDAPLQVDAATWAALDAFAAQTYVPETEASRARGAGAGQIDND